jgi:hypothetical protein
MDAVIETILARRFWLEGPSRKSVPLLSIWAFIQVAGFRVVEELNR